MIPRTFPITVSADTYRRLVHFPLPGGSITGTFNTDGTVTFPVTANLLHQLGHIDRDPEIALRKLLSLSLQ